MVAKEVFTGSFALYYEKVINRISSPLYVNRWRKSLIRGALAFIPKPQVVIDFCSGAANIGELLLKEIPSCKLINCDISPKLLNLAKEKLGKSSFFICSDNRFFPIKDNSVDLIFSSFCVRNSLEPELTIKEAKRTLKPGGVWGVLDFFRKENSNFSFTLNNLLFKSFMNLNKLASEENKKAINYLFESIEKFLSLKEFKEIVENFGFKVAQTKDFMGGLASTLIAIKEEV
ncbi:class I SAM-dependent methyltransferase [Thermovibrio sp.]